MPKSNSENYEGDEKTYVNKIVDEIVSSYRLLFRAQKHVVLIFG